MAENCVRSCRAYPGRWTPRETASPYVFTRNSQCIKSIREIFSRVCRDAGRTNVVFHDQRHTATTTLRRAVVATLTAMKITGHKTMAACERYNTIDEDDLTVAQRQMDTYMDTRTVRP